MRGMGSNPHIYLRGILEKIYNASLEEIYFQFLGKPLDVERTSWEIGYDEPNAAVCYRRHRDDEPKRFDDENVQIWGKPAGSGGQQSCLCDIKKFVTAVLEKSELLYSEEMYELAEQNYTPNYSEGRGLGWLVVDEKYPQTGELFPIGSFGHCGHTGQSIFMNRENNLYVIILTNATRFAAMKNDFKGYDYGDVMRMRADIHNAIKKDLVEQGLLK